MNPAAQEIGSDNRKPRRRANVRLAFFITPLLIGVSSLCIARQTLPNTQFSIDGKVRLDGSSGLREAYLPVLFPSSHASNLLLLRNGDLLCAWFSGTREGASGVAILLSRLKHGSDQWSAPVVVDRQEGRSFQNPVLFEAPDGKLWLFHSSQEADRGEANAMILYLTSVDGGTTWSAPKPLFTKPGSFDRQPLVILPNGDWLLPMYYASGGQKLPSGVFPDHPAMQISSNRGATWKEFAVHDAQGLVQPIVLHLHPQRTSRAPAAPGFVAFFRSRAADWIYRSTSPDGYNWSAPIRTPLPNNNASIGAAVLKDGRIVMVFNNCNASDAHGPAGKPPRKPLTIALSADAGITWPWVRDIQTGNEPGAGQAGGSDEYSYPSIVQSPDESLYLTYTFRRLTVKYVVFDEPWIERGGTIGRYQSSAARSVEKH
ncbi:MAG: sialidase family protein [Candidatus Acidiferrales bacterium]